MTFRGPQSSASSADPASGQSIDRGLNEKLLRVIAESPEPLSTAEIAKRAQVWPYQASSVLCDLRTRGKVRVVGKVKGEGFGISRRLMNVWGLA